MGVLTVIGFFTTIFLASYFGKEAYVRVARPTDWSEYKGEWAVVTGSSYGIGRCFALELAKKGLNVVLTARTRPKLDEVAKEIKALYPNIQVKIVIQDAAKPEFERIASELKGLPISVLINNVGGGNVDGTAKKLHEFPTSHHDYVHATNFEITRSWTLFLLPQMYERKKGRIISCSSLGHLFGYGTSIYPADKGAIHSLTYGINNEYNLDGIRAEALVIGMVSTPALGSPEQDVLGIVTNPEDLTKNALEMFGYWEVYSPTLGHAFNWFSGWAMPTSLRAYAARNGVEQIHSWFAAGRAAITDLQQKKKDL